MLCAERCAPTVGCRAGVAGVPELEDGLTVGFFSSGQGVGDGPWVARLDKVTKCETVIQDRLGDLGGWRAQT